MFSPPSENLSRRFSLDEILSATNNFDDSLVIGKGGFGKVYRGNIIDNNGNGASASSTTTVAIKCLNPLSKQGAPEFWTEVHMLSKFRHRHLVSLIGYCDNCNEMILVYEYMVRGTLADHLHRNDNDNSSPLSWVQRLKICIGAARGLDYLHTGTAKSVIHLDVKSSNILLDENWAAKISDFGLSRIGPVEQECSHVSTTHIKGTIGYIDPNYLLTHRFTRKSDVYAFGVVLLEVLCERPAWDQRGLARWGQQFIKDGASHKIIGPNLKQEIFPNSLMEFVQIADKCLDSRPKQRPTMSEVVAKLELALASQLRTDLVTEEYVFDNCLPVNNQENAVSYQEDDHIYKVLQLGDSSSKQFSPVGENADSVKVLQRKSHGQVELSSPMPKPSTKEPKADEKETPKPEEKKEEFEVVTVVLKVHMHCNACPEELKKCIKKFKGVESADPDLKGSQVTVKGVFNPEQLVIYVYRQTRKRAVIVKTDPENKKEEDKGKQEKKSEEPATTEKEKQIDKHAVIVKTDPENKKEEEKKAKEPAAAEKKKQIGKHRAIVKPDPKNKKEEDKGKEEKKTEESAAVEKRKPGPDNKKAEDKGKEGKKAEEPTASKKKTRTGKHAVIVKPDPENRKEEDNGKEEKKAEQPAAAEKKNQTGKHAVIVKLDSENKKEEDNGKEEKKAQESAAAEKKRRTGKDAAIVEKAEESAAIEKKKQIGKHATIVMPDPDNKKAEDKGKERKKAEEPAASEKKWRTGKYAVIVKTDPENKKEEEKKAEEPAAAEKEPDPENKKEEENGKEEKKAEETETPKPEEKKEESEVVTVVLKVHMHCNACPEELKKCIKKFKGVESADPDLKSSQVTVKGVFDPKQLVKHVHKQIGKCAVIVKPDPENKKEEDKGKQDKKIRRTRHH